MWIALICLYIIGFLLGRKYEKDRMLEGVYGVLSQINKTNLEVDSITYYYSKDAYDAGTKKLKELGEEYYEE